MDHERKLLSVYIEKETEREIERESLSAERRRIAEETGKVAVEIAKKSFSPKKFFA